MAPVADMALDVSEMIENPTRRALGSYAAITLDTARDKARTWLDLIRHGIDPAEQEARERAAEQRKRLPHRAWLLQRAGWGFFLSVCAEPNTAAGSEKVSARA